MHRWPLQDAGARFGDMLERCLAEGPQLVTDHGVGTAVLVSAEEWDRANARRRLGRKEVLLTDFARGEIPRAHFETLPPPFGDFGD